MKELRLIIVSMPCLLALFFAANVFAHDFDAGQPGRSAADSSASKPALAVIGMSNEVENEDWRDARVGMGLRAILSQLFFDSGYFLLLEEKPEIRQKLNALATGIWALQGEHDFKEALHQAGELGADFVVYGRVTYFGTPKTRVSFGPMHVRRNAVVINVEATLEDLKTGRKIKEKGQGESATTAGSAIFNYREDRVELDKTNVGNATKKALSEAVGKILKEFKKKYATIQEAQ